MPSKALRLLIYSLILMGFMGTSCVRDGGYAYQKFSLSKCLPEEFDLPVKQVDEKKNRSVKLNSKPEKGCPDVGAYLYYVKGKRVGPIFYPIMKREGGKCSLVVAFDVYHGGAIGKVPDIKESYTYKLGAKHLRDVAETLLFGVQAQVVKASEVIGVEDSKKEIGELCNSSSRK